LAESADNMTDAAAVNSTAASKLALVELINDLLPQTQCGQCGHQGCRPYAEAVALGEDLNRCPPGGAVTIRELAALLGREVLPLDPEHGIEKERRIASIREAECIGCTKCIQACPVDAILGAPKLMHTVIVSECTGCDLCVDPCPVDCIDMLLVPAAELVRMEVPAARKQQSASWRQRYEFRQQRLLSLLAAQVARRKAGQDATPAGATKTSDSPPMSEEQARANIQAAVLRAKARKEALRNTEN
jgi:RnfABCDGE-type electron transport complex B subunit